MGLFNRKRDSGQLRVAFEKACAHVADIKRRHSEAVGPVPDSEIYRLMDQLTKDLGPVYLSIDGILDEYLEIRHARLQ